MPDKLDKKAVLAALYRMPMFLEDVRTVPRMFFGDDVPNVMNFLRGMQFLYGSLGIQDDYLTIFNSVAEERGWPIRAHHPYHYMVERGMDEDAITAEVLAIEIEVWKRMLDSL